MLTQAARRGRNDVATEGKDAKFSVDGKSKLRPPTNTVTNAIAGVTLTLGGTTPVGQPVTVVIGAPQANTSAIGSTGHDVRQRLQLDHRPDQRADHAEDEHQRPDPGSAVRRQRPDEPAQQHAHGDVHAERGADAGFQSLADIGISTGAASGSAAFSQDAVSGQADDRHDGAQQRDPEQSDGVKAMLQSFGRTASRTSSTTRRSRRVDRRADPGEQLRDQRHRRPDRQPQPRRSALARLRFRLSSRSSRRRSPTSSLRAAGSRSRSTRCRCRACCRTLRRRTNCFNFSGRRPIIGKRYECLRSKSPQRIPRERRAHGIARAARRDALRRRPAVPVPGRRSDARAATSKPPT